MSLLEDAPLLPGKGGGVGQLAHALDEQPGRQQQPDAYRQHHVEQHGEDQAGQQHQHVAARGDAQHVHHVRCFAHVPGHYHQQRRQCCHWQIAEQRRQPENRDQHHAGVDHRGQWRKRAGPDIGRAAGDGGGRGDATEQWRDQIAQPLADQLAVGLVAAAGHAIGDDGAE